MTNTQTDIRREESHVTLCITTVTFPSSNSALEQHLPRQTAPGAKRQLGAGVTVARRAPPTPGRLARSSSGCWPVFAQLSPLWEHQAHFLDEKTASRVRKLDRVTFLFKNQEWNVHFGLQLHRQTSALMATPRLDPTLWALPSRTG